MHRAEYWISRLKLQPHPEGGFFKETYQSRENILSQSLPPRYSGSRAFSTAIYFLLRSNDCSILHRLKSDELWHFYAGTSLTLYILRDSGLTAYQLGSNPEKHQSFQAMIPGNTWFGATVDAPDSYTLVGCTMAPGFDYQDFEIADRRLLLKDYPDHSAIIMRLTKVPSKKSFAIFKE